MTVHKRKNYLVDAKVQGALILHCVIYWFACIATMLLLWLAWRIVVLPEQASFFDYFKLSELSAQFAPAVIASLVLLPIVVFDVIRLSNRFAGPVYRLRRVMRQAALGRPAQPLRFREGDFWDAVAADFNALLARVNELEQNDLHARSEHSQELITATVEQ